MLLHTMDSNVYLSFENIQLYYFTIQNRFCFCLLLFRAQHLSNLGCLSSYSTLQDIRERMMYEDIMLRFSEKFLDVYP